MTIKIIAGKYKGIMLEVPDSARPTLAKNRQSLFDMIESLDSRSLTLSHQNNFGEFFKNLIVLDCFAGSGALGLEALSRGASHAYFIDNDKQAISIIHKNILKIKEENSTTVLYTPIEKLKNFEKYRPTHVDIAFLDPPYEKSSLEKIIKNLCNINWICKNTLLILESHVQKSPPPLLENFHILKSKKIGISEFTIALIKGDVYS